jgi:4-hydroxyphenylpyruvate dioxygenase
LRGYDHVEFYVGNAKQAAHYYRSAFGFRPVAYAGPETGVADRASYVMAQGAIRFVLTAGLAPDHPAVRHQAAHGDGVHSVAFAVDDVEAAYRTVLANGAQPVREPRVRDDDLGAVVTASIAAYGDTVHTFVQRDGYRGAFLPGFVPYDAPVGTSATGLRAIDHVVANVPDGTMDEWSRFYADLLGFSELVHFDDGLHRPAQPRHVGRCGDGEAAHQRARGGAAYVADHRVPRLLRRSRRATPCARDRRHRDDRARTARQRR